MVKLIAHCMLHETLKSSCLLKVLHWLLNETHIGRCDVLLDVSHHVALCVYIVYGVLVNGLAWLSVLIVANIFRNAKLGPVTVNFVVSDDFFTFSTTGDCNARVSISHVLTLVMRVSFVNTTLRKISNELIILCMVNSHPAIAVVIHAQVAKVIGDEVWNAADLSG